MTDLGSFDCVVVGGGAAGSAAAIVAARLGLSVALVEPLSFLGGTGVGAMVTPWMSNRIVLGELNHGLNGELQQRLEAIGAAEGYTVDPEALKGELEDLAIDAGVRLWFEVSLVEVACEDLGDGRRRVAELTVATRSGLGRLRGGVLIDASGDARVAHRAGLPCREGREEDRTHQPMSLRFVLGGIDHEALRSFLRGHGVLVETGQESFTHTSVADLMRPWVETLGWPESWVQRFTMQFFALPRRPGELWFNCPRIAGYDPFNAASMSDAYVEGRRLIRAYLELWRRHIPGAERAYLAQVAPMMGVREGRRIRGEYVLTGDDFLSRAKFADGVCFNRYPIDIHSSTGGGVEWVDPDDNDWHEIPYRCLFNREFAGLLVAGRCISSDFTAQASYRIIPNCRTLGEAAGVAAALSGSEGVDVTSLDGRAVRQRMVELEMLPDWG